MNTRKMHRTPVSTTPFGNQIGMSNAIFEIRSVFDLGGSTVTFEEDCILYFNGGLLTNGTIVGNKTAIDAPITQIFAHNLHVEGTWLVDGVYPDWFGCNYDCHKVTERDPVTNLDSSYWTGTDDSDAFNRAVEMAENCDIRKVKLSSGKYYINSPILINKGNILIEGVSGQLREEIYPIPTGQQSNDVDQISQSVIFVENDKDGFVISSTVCNNIMMSHINLVGAQEWKQGNANLTSNAINFMSDFGGPTWPVIFKYCHFQYFHRAFYLNSSYQRYSIHKLEIDHCSFWHNDYCVYFEDLLGIARTDTGLTEPQVQWINNHFSLSGENAYIVGQYPNKEHAIAYNKTIYFDYESEYATGFTQLCWQMLFTNNCCHQNARILHANVQKDSLVIENNNSEGTLTSFSDGTSNAAGYAYDIQTGQQCHIRFVGNHFEGMGCKLLKVFSDHYCADTIEMFGNNTNHVVEKQPQFAEAHFRHMHILSCDMPAVFSNCVADDFRQDFAKGIESSANLTTPFIPFGNYEESDERIIEPNNIRGHIQYVNTSFGRIPMIASPLNLTGCPAYPIIAHYDIADDFSQDKLFKVAFVIRSEQMKHQYFGKLVLSINYFGPTTNYKSIETQYGVAKKSNTEYVFQTTGVMEGVSGATSVSIDILMMFGDGTNSGIFNPNSPVMISIPYLTYRDKNCPFIDFHLPYTFIQQICNTRLYPIVDNPSCCYTGITCEKGDIVSLMTATDQKEYVVTTTQSGTIDAGATPSLNGTYTCNQGERKITASSRLIPGVYLKIGTQKLRVIKLVGKQPTGGYIYAVSERINTTVSTPAVLMYYKPKFTTSAFHYTVTSPMSQRLLELLENGTFIFYGNDYVINYVKDGELISFFIGLEGLHP